jgi:hypothetical protein
MGTHKHLNTSNFFTSLAFQGVDSRESHSQKVESWVIETLNNCISDHLYKRIRMSYSLLQLCRTPPVEI